MISGIRFSEFACVDGSGRAQAQELIVLGSILSNEVKQIRPYNNTSEINVSMGSKNSSFQLFFLLRK